MSKCPICNRDPKALGGFDCAIWCKACSDEYYETNKQNIVEWAANKARAQERAAIAQYVRQSSLTLDLAQIAERIVQGKHWPEGETP